MAATLEEIREKNRQLAESNLSKQNAINEVRLCAVRMYNTGSPHADNTTRCLVDLHCAVVQSSCGGYGTFGLSFCMLHTYTTGVSILLRSLTRNMRHPPALPLSTGIAAISPCKRATSLPWCVALSTPS
jgi:hypothetical protein